MGEPPAFAGELAKRLREPASQSQIVEVPKNQAVLFPEQIKR
jgi:hypothetical protein